MEQYKRKRQEQDSSDDSGTEWINSYSEYVDSQRTQTSREGVQQRDDVLAAATDAVEARQPSVGRSHQSANLTTPYPSVPSSSNPTAAAGQGLRIGDMSNARGLEDAFRYMPRPAAERQGPFTGVPNAPWGPPLAPATPYTHLGPTGGPSMFPSVPKQQGNGLPPPNRRQGQHPPQRAAATQRPTHTLQDARPGVPNWAPAHSPTAHSPRHVAASPATTIGTPRTAGSIGEFNAIAAASQFPIQRVERTVDGVRTAIYYCDVLACNSATKAYVSESELRKHQRCHISQDDYPYVCHCGQRYLYEGHLRNHQDTRHNGVRFQCPYCDKSADRYDNLVGSVNRPRHVRVMHPGLPIPTKEQIIRRPGNGQQYGALAMSLVMPATPLRQSARGVTSTPGAPRQGAAQRAVAGPSTPVRQRAPSVAQMPSPTDERNIDPRLRDWQYQQGFNAARSPSVSYSTSAAAYMTPPMSRTSSSSITEMSARRQRGDSFGLLSPPETPTLGVSGQRRSYSEVVKQPAYRAQLAAPPPTPPRSVASSNTSRGKRSPANGHHSLPHRPKSGCYSPYTLGQGSVSRRP